MLFCPIPWIHQAVRNNGDMRVCCQANQGPDRGLLRKPDGTIYNASVDDLDECRNSQKLKDIRKCFINGEWHPDCIRCEREEISKIDSRFTYEKRLWADIIKDEDAKAKTKSDGSINVKDFPVVSYDLRFGNLCNLKCRMCGPTDSSSWYSDYVKLWDYNIYDDTAGKMKIIKVDGKYTVENDIYSWYESETFWKQIDEKIPNIILIQMVGGEPFLIKQQFDFLRRCITKNHAHKINIEQTSNIVYIPDEAWNLWKNFKSVKIGASIDGLEKVNEYIRYPSKWETVKNNLNRLDKAEGNFKIRIAFTVQALNILQLPKMINWTLNQPFNRICSSPKTPIITAHPLHSPHFLNVKVLPFDVKKKIEKYFSEFTFSRETFKAKRILNQYCDYMLQDDYSSKLNMFWKYNNRLDEIRNQKMQDYIPELYEMIGGTNVI